MKGQDSQGDSKEIGMSLEIFKPIDDYPGYDVTSWGRVFSRRNNMFLHPYPTEKGYLRVDVYDEDGDKKHVKVHRLVAKTFLPNPDNKPQVNHIDGNPQNNSVTNLEWVTNGENAEKARVLRMISKGETER